MTHQDYLHRCYELAMLGGKAVGTNPNVGAVIVHNNRIIGEGFHQRYGEPHAEVNAFKSVAAEDKKLLPESTIYVSLEPCSHFGKTPPCANLLVKKKIKSCHIGTIDTSDKVSGKGIEMLKSNGIEVTIHNDVKAQEIIRPWTTFTHKKRPFITLKFAQSKDFFIGKEDKQVWLSNAYSKVLAHKLRAENDAILVGTNTARMDNPSLTTRAYPGENPIRMVIDKQLSLDENLNIFNGEKTVIFNSLKSETVDNKTYVQCQNEDFTKEILDYCHQNKIARLLVEGGANVLKKFIAQNLWDDAYILQTDKVLTFGIKAPNLQGSLKQKLKLENDNILIINSI